MIKFLLSMPGVLALFLSAASLIVVSSGFAEVPCSGVFKDVVFSSTSGDSGAFANLRGSSDSVSVKSKSMLTGATAKFPGPKPEENICPQGCNLAPEPLIVYTSKPAKFLKDYSESAACNKLLEQTEKNPITFSDRRFGSVDELDKYIGELCQGKGADGKELYRQCYGSCSPAFEARISIGEGNFSLTTLSVCGPARDKDEGQILLSASYRWQCVPN